VFGGLPSVPSTHGRRLRNTTSSKKLQMQITAHNMQATAGEMHVNCRTDRMTRATEPACLMRLGIISRRAGIWRYVRENCQCVRRLAFASAQVRMRRSAFGVVYWVRCLGTSEERIIFDKKFFGLVTRQSRHFRANHGNHAQQPR
jgi:hypothetical protein